MFYFDLVSMRSYKTSGYTGIRYVFYKGKPTKVEVVEDANKFRNQPEIFLEVDENGNKVQPVKKNKDSKAYKKFRQFGDDPSKDHEDVLKEAFDQAVAVRQQGVDVNELLKAANEDALNKDDNPDEEEKLDDNNDNPDEEDNNPDGETGDETPDTPKVIKKTKKSKKDSLACDKCGRKDFKNKEELDAHEQDHLDEE